MENEYNYLQPFGTINGTQRSQHSKYSQNFDSAQCRTTATFLTTGTFILCWQQTVSPRKEDKRAEWI